MEGVPCTICTMEINRSRNIIQLEHFVLCSMFYDCTFSTNLETELSASDRMFKIGLIWSWSWISGIPTFAAYYQPIPVEIPLYPPIHPLWSPMIRCDDDFNYIPGITEAMRTMRFIFSLICVTSLSSLEAILRLPGAVPNIYVKTLQEDMWRVW